MSLTDHELIWQLKQLDNDKNVVAMRDLLKREGGIGRILTLAERGLTVKPKPPAGKSSIDTTTPTLLPDGFPDLEAKAKAIAYWNGKFRPDLVADVDQIADGFRDYHGNRHATMAKSWALTWVTWYRNQVTMRQPPRAPGPLFAAPRLAFEQANEAGWLGRIKGFYQTGYWGDTWGGKPPARACEAVPDGCMCPPGVLARYWQQTQQACQQRS